MRLSGAVLAGGASRRMGTDKALLIFEGEPLWRRQTNVLRMAGAEQTLLVRRPDQAPPWGDEPVPEGVTLRRDAFMDAGPLAGLQAALAAAEADWIAVLAVDMPGIDPSWFRWLFGFCQPGIGAVARHAEAFEPLAAIYPKEALAEVLGRLHKRDLSLQRLVAAVAASGQMIVLPLPLTDLARVRSWNCPSPP